MKEQIKLGCTAALAAILGLTIQATMLWLFSVLPHQDWVQTAALMYTESILIEEDPEVVQVAASIYAASILIEEDK